MSLSSDLPWLPGATHAHLRRSSSNLFNGLGDHPRVRPSNCLCPRVAPCPEMLERSHCPRKKGWSEYAEHTKIGGATIRDVCAKKDAREGGACTRKGCSPHSQPLRVDGQDSEALGAVEEQTTPTCR